jgi:ketosteroid isomerase-like protein
MDLLDRLHAAQAAFYSGQDDSAVRDVLTEDIAWHVPGDNAIAGDYHGIDEVLDYFTRRRDRANGTFRMHPRDVLTGTGDHVAALTDGTATIGGVEHSWSTVGLYRLRDERIAECWLLPLDPVAFDAIWST